MGTGGDGAGDLGQVGVHRRRVDKGQDQPCGGTARGAEGTKQMRPLMAGVAGCAGSGAAPGPDAGQGSLLTHARVRHGPRTGGGTMANFWNQISSGLSRALAGIGAATASGKFFERRLRLRVRLSGAGGAPAAAEIPVPSLPWGGLQSQMKEKFRGRSAGQHRLTKSRGRF